MEERWAIPWSGLALILVTILVTCSGVFASDYGFSDDFCALPTGPVTAKVFLTATHNFLGEGRGLFAIWTVGVIGQVDTIQGLRFVRLLSLFGPFFTSILFFKLIRRHLFPDGLTASLVSCIFAINPSFLIMAGWASIGCDSFASLLGLSSIYVLLRDDYFNQSAANSKNEPTGLFHPGPKGLRVLAAGLLLFASLSLYQPGAMMYWTGVTIWIIGQFRARTADWMRLVKIVTIFMLVLGAYFLFSRALADPNARFHVSVSIIRRLGWFVLYPLQNALSYPSIQPFPFWSILALFILSFGLWLYCQRTSRPMWIPPLVLPVTLLSVLPTVFAYNHYDVSRTRVALYGILIVVWCVSLEAILSAYKPAFKLRPILTLALVCLVVSGQYHLQRYLIIPQLREQSALLVKLQEYVRENPSLDRVIAIRPPPKTQLLTGFPGVDEMGIASSSQPWATSPLILRILTGITHRDFQDIQHIKIVSLHDDETPLGNSFEIDLRELHAP